MKIIALLPVKNEAWILPSYLSSISLIADEIIALDDSSIDSSRDILTNAGVKIISKNQINDELASMGKKRQLLLDAGRQANGTHFIWLDADESFSSNFILNAREEILKLKPGQKMSLRWVHFWRDTLQYLDDNKSPFGNIYKDFIYCDDKLSSFEDKILSEGRTPGNFNNVVSLNEEKGVVLHFQFLNEDAMHYKHAWYKCQELIEGNRSARRINTTYKVNYDEEGLYKTRGINPEWVLGIELPKGSNPVIWHKDAILDYFEKYGILFFEPLEIWKLDFLREKFVSETGRMPKVKVFPKWILILNNYKNLILNILR